MLVVEEQEMGVSGKRSIVCGKWNLIKVMNARAIRMRLAWKGDRFLKEVDGERYLKGPKPLYGIATKRKTSPLTSG